MIAAHAAKVETQTPFLAGYVGPEDPILFATVSFAHDVSWRSDVRPRLSRKDCWQQVFRKAVPTTFLLLL